MRGGEVRLRRLAFPLLSTRGGILESLGNSASSASFTAAPAMMLPELSNSFPEQPMKTIVLIAYCILVGSAVAQDQMPVVGKLDASLQQKTKSLNPQYLLYSPKEKSDTALPLLIYLHGAGGVGDNIHKISGQATPVWRGVEKFANTPCIVVAPQCNKRVSEGGGWIPDDLNILLQHLKATLSVDEKRIYLSGNSMGGYGSWAWGAHNPEHFAAIAPISGGIGPGGPKDVTPHLDKWAANLANVPVHAFAGGKDKVVPAERSQRMIAAIKRAGGKEATIKIYPDEGHNARRAVLSTVEFYDWMFSKKRE
jgi:predicted peptidase